MYKEEDIAFVERFFASFADKNAPQKELLSLLR